jgi:endoglucanase
MREVANGYFDKKRLEEIMFPAIEAAKKSNLPLYCGEFGVYPTIPDEISYKWYKDVCEIFNENNIAYCHWCYKGDFPVVGEKSTLNRKLVSILTAE